MHIKKKIEFYPIQGFEELAIPPEPAKKNIPDWYRKMPSDIEPEKSVRNSTSKRCMPLMDSLTAGYYFFSYADISVSVEHGCSKIEWMHETEVISEHSRQQVPGMPLPNGFYKDEAFKWFNPVVMKTPPGYSTLFVTPTLKHELPFWCFPAIVDTDKYNAAIHFPFLIRKNWKGIIRRETPIIQAIPFRRENWESEWVNKSKDNNSQISFIKTYLNSAYKKNWWVKKSWN